MKMLLCFLLLSTNVFATINSLKFKVAPGELHTGGSLEAIESKVDTSNKMLEVQLKYNIIKKPLIPAPANMLKNIFTIELPLDFQDERGYLYLEQGHTIETDKVIARHAGRVKIGSFNDVHHVRIKGKNGKYVCDVYYHPSIPELGWMKLGLWLNLSLLSNYQINADLEP